jgi:glycosyltransferase involved in cell wall biosynthesis
MKILHVYKTYYPDSTGGVEKSIENMAQGLKKLKVSSKILTLSNNVSVNKKVISLKKTFEIFSTPFSFKLLFKFKSISNKYDIIHFHFPWPFIDLVFLLSNIKKPTVLTYHSDIVKQSFLKVFYYPIMILFLKRIDKIVSTSPNYLKSSKILQKFKSKTEVIPLGISKKNYKIKKSKIPFFEKKYGKNFIIFVGVLRYYKGIEFLINSIKETNYKLYIVGNGKEYHKYNSIIKDYNLKNIKLLRSVSDKELPYLIKLSKCLILPSHLRSEAFGISLLEGLMFEKPLISCNIKTGTSFINIHNKTGFVVKPGNSYSLTNALNKIYSKKNKLNYFKNNSKKWFNLNFTQEKMSNSYYKLYKSLINNKSVS